MTGSVLPFGASQAAELVTPETKREANALAQACLAGIAVRKVRMPGGAVVYASGLRKFMGVEQLEDWLDSLGAAQ